MVEASSPRGNDSEGEEFKGEREPRQSIMVTDPKIFENDGKTGDIFTDESCLAFTVKNP